MNKKEKQRIAFWIIWITFCVLCWIPTIQARAAQTNLTAGVASLLADALNNPEIEEVEVEDTEVEIVEEPQEYILVDSTAYYDKYKVRKVHGYTLTEGRTLAGMTAWRGKWVELYRVNKDGTVGSLIGSYRFEDVGYGQSTGYGHSKLLKGKSVGTIECGLCIDIYFNTYRECVNYGRQKVYMKWK